MKAPVSSIFVPSLFHRRVFVWYYCIVKDLLKFSIIVLVIDYSRISP